MQKGERCKRYPVGNKTLHRITDEKLSLTTYPWPFSSSSKLITYSLTDAQIPSPSPSKSTMSWKTIITDFSKEAITSVYIPQFQNIINFLLGLFLFFASFLTCLFFFSFHKSLLKTKLNFCASLLHSVHIIYRGIISRDN